MQDGLEVSFTSACIYVQIMSLDFPSGLMPGTPTSYPSGRSHNHVNHSLKGVLVSSLRLDGAVHSTDNAVSSIREAGRAVCARQR